MPTITLDKKCQLLFFHTKIHNFIILFQIMQNTTTECVVRKIFLSQPVTHHFFLQEESPGGTFLWIMLIAHFCSSAYPVFATRDLWIFYLLSQCKAS